MAGSGPSRRAVVGGGLGLGAGALLPLTSAAPRRAVVAFHGDRLYLDRSGVAQAYAPPPGLRSLDGLDEDALRRLIYHI